MLTRYGYLLELDSRRNSGLAVKIAAGAALEAGSTLETGAALVAIATLLATAWLAATDAHEFSAVVTACSVRGTSDISTMTHSSGPFGKISAGFMRAEMKYKPCSVEQLRAFCVSAGREYVSKETLRR